MGRNVPMYKTNIECEKAGVFEGPLVCSMRPMTPENAKKAAEITEKFPNVHGGPVHMGDPEKIGIKDIDHPDYGDPVEIREGEIPVFWACGVTPQAAVERAKPPIVITHAPGHMFITNVKNAELNDYLEKKKQGTKIAVKQKESQHRRCVISCQHRTWQILPDRCGSEMFGPSRVRGSDHRVFGLRIVDRIRNLCYSTRR